MQLIDCNLTCYLSQDVIPQFRGHRCDQDIEMDWNRRHPKIALGTRHCAILWSRVKVFYNNVDAAYRHNFTIRFSVCTAS